MISQDLLAILVCPATKHPLTYDPSTEELLSKEAGLAYPVRQGIPILLVEEARIMDEEKAKVYTSFSEGAAKK